MIRYQDAAEVAYYMLGTPYDHLDCINYIKWIIRYAKGGIRNYTDSGTNGLWQSYIKRGKYQHLIERHEGIKDAKAGWLVFKSRGNDVFHVGFFTADGTILHSSSVAGEVVEEKQISSAWNKCGKSRYIITGD